jgi:hypothetical protein
MRYFIGRITIYILSPHIVMPSSAGITLMTAQIWTVFEVSFQSAITGCEKYFFALGSRPD